VARKHNLLLSPDDPLLVTITLNEVILRRIIASQQQAIEAAQDQISAGAAQQLDAARQVAGILITGAADYVAGELRTATAALKSELLEAAAAQKDAAIAAAQDARRAQSMAWWAVMVIVVVLCVVLGIAIGHAPRLPAAPPAASGTTATR
jgi:beta-mannanase